MKVVRELWNGFLFLLALVGLLLLVLWSAPIIKVLASQL